MSWSLDIWTKKWLVEDSIWCDLRCCGIRKGWVALLSVNRHGLECMQRWTICYWVLCFTFLIPDQPWPRCIHKLALSRQYVSSLEAFFCTKSEILYTNGKMLARNWYQYWQYIDWKTDRRYFFLEMKKIRKILWKH